MAEERLIDDDKDRKYKIRINSDGEEELIIDAEGEDEEENTLPVFEVPVYEEDDEEAVALTPEQLAERERVKKEEEAAREERVRALCAKTREKLEDGDFESANYLISQAEELTARNGEVSCLKLKTLTRGFTDYTSLEQCAECAEAVKEFADRESRAELKKLAVGLPELVSQAEEAARVLSEENESKKDERRTAFTQEKKRAFTGLLATAVPFAALLIVTLVFASMMFAKENGAFLIATFALGGVSFVALICALVAANKYWAAVRRLKLNESDSSTKLGREYSEKKRRYELLNRINAILNDDIS